MIGFVDKFENILLQEKIDREIFRIESFFPVKVLGYSLIGSVPLGMGNCTSDYDVVAVYEASSEICLEDYELLKSDSVFFRKTKCAGEVNILLLDFKIFDSFFIDMHIDELHINYPQYVNTLTSHDRRFSNLVLPGDNSSKLASIFTDMFYYGNGVIVDPHGFFAKNFTRMTGLLTVYDYCKRRYVTTLGRLNCYLRVEGGVRLRTYLQSFSDILALEYALYNSRIPFPDIVGMLDMIDDSQVESIVRDYLFINNNSLLPKERLLVSPNFYLNNWISARLEGVKSDLEELYFLNKKHFFDFEVF